LRAIAYEFQGEIMTQEPEYSLARPETGGHGRSAAQPGTFIITLCSVQTPITIPKPRASEITRFRFFFSYCREDGARRYRLHLGYFPTLAEADKWFKILRRIYPDAYVTEGSAIQTDMLSDTQILTMSAIRGERTG
jgi:hypothetical protein